MKGRIKPHGPLGIALFCLACIMLGQGKEPFTTYFYAFAWWSYIAAADALVYWIRGESLIVNKTSTFLLMIPLSIFIWCIFEGFNFRLANWHYIHVPHEYWWRWIGYAGSYGTVLPGLCVTTHLVQAGRPFQAVSWRRWQLTPLFLWGMIAVGGASLLASFIFPRYCFPLVWIGFALLLEPILYLSGNASLLQDIENGRPSRLLNHLTAGLVCGLLWELWNFWAQTKWIYTVPFFEEAKLFEMPLLGFLGFPPFAVSAYALYRALLIAMQRHKLWMRGILGLVISLSCLLCFAGIDRYTVISFIPFIRDLPGVQEEWKERLHRAGLEKVQDLMQSDVPALVHLGIPGPEAEELVRQAEMIILKGMGIENYRLLQEAGVRDLSELAEQDPEALYQTIEKIPRREPLTHAPPTPALVRLWVGEAGKKFSGPVRNLR
jgi:hypothetical protein